MDNDPLTENDPQLFILAQMHETISDSLETRKKLQELLDREFPSDKVKTVLQPLTSAMQSAIEDIDRLIFFVKNFYEAYSTYHDGFLEISAMLENNDSYSGKTWSKRQITLRFTSEI